MAATICDILSAAAALLGAPGATDAIGLGDTLGGKRRIAVLLVDGMGRHLLDDLAADAPLLAAAAAGTAGRLDTLECVFPSTTPTNLVSLGTGVAPGQHGVLGFTVNVPGTERVLIHIIWHDDPPPHRWQPVPTWFARLNAAGIPARAVLPAPFLESGLTAAAYGGAELIGTGNGDDYAQVLLDTLHRGPGLVYGYLSAVDTAAHRFGIGSPQWRAAAAYADTVVARLLDGLPDDAALLITADHGGLNITESDRIDLDAEPALLTGVRVVAGEPRVRYLHTAPGAAPDVQAAWSERLTGYADVQTREEAIDAGLFGPVDEEFLPRIGDLVVTCTGAGAVMVTAHEPPQISEMIGFHGAKTAVEMTIPLISFG
ncbi:nucleotide pyrophosphatase/phosphodiesterase family protein [Mycobacterium sp. 1274756.6]|uniref:alkaline phosphatase family protein n=1 Tax=Mycobacterium sp. 1274756.6 TaxID=1834076 RepID=UPI0008023497|nr:nucleotide pyrophosphatase/phosphodiesterase family protein [Mycobacterium sp. 1274756.6]OBJ69122.1 nucleotide pyrophosphatase [Mycobacterium sp. 1274756.6]